MPKPQLLNSFPYWDFRSFRSRKFIPEKSLAKGLTPFRFPSFLEGFRALESAPFFESY
jgi:hypothetical protein